MTNEEFKQNDGVPNTAGASSRLNDSTREAPESGLHTVEAQLAPDGNEVRTVIVAEAKSVTVKWFQRRWITLGLALIACGLVVVVVVLVVRQQSAATTSSSLESPTPAPISLTPFEIACNFLSISNVTKCRSTFVFGGTTTGSTIPSEIGLLTQLMELAFYNKALTSSIPSEIGLLTQLVYLDFYANQLTSTIPSEIGLLTQLTLLNFFNNTLTSTIPSEIGRMIQLSWLTFSTNALTSTIPSEIGLLTQLLWLSLNDNLLTGAIPSSLCSLPSLDIISIDCGEITCALGCCSNWDGVTLSSCG